MHVLRVGRVHDLRVGGLSGRVEWMSTCSIHVVESV